MNSRDKGSRFELSVAKAFSEALGIVVRRTPLSGGWADKPDIKGDLVRTDGNYWPYCVECKHQEGWNLESLFTDKHEWFDAWWKQLMEECPSIKMPILVFTKNRAPVFAAVPINRDIHVPDVELMIKDHDGYGSVIIMRIEPLLSELQRIWQSQIKQS